MQIYVKLTFQYFSFCSGSIFICEKKISYLSQINDLCYIKHRFLFYFVFTSLHVLNLNIKEIKLCSIEDVRINEFFVRNILIYVYNYFKYFIFNKPVHISQNFFSTHWNRKRHNSSNQYFFNLYMFSNVRFRYMYL